MIRLVRLWLRIRLDYLRLRQRETAEAGERLLAWSGEYGTTANEIERRLVKMRVDRIGRKVLREMVRR